MKKALLAIGSNVGDTLANLKEAVALLEAEGCIIAAKSNLYQTEPWGFKDQEDFLNGALVIETSLGVRQLLNVTQGIEKKMGRKKEFLNGPRNIDLDIILYEDEVVNEADLVVPHPRFHQRLFVLKPMADIAPNWQVGTLGTVEDILANYDGDEGVELTNFVL